MWPWGALIFTGLVLLATLVTFVRYLVGEGGWIAVAIVLLGPLLLCGLAFVFVTALAEVANG